VSDARAEMSATVDRIAGRFRRAPDVRELWQAWRYRLAGSPERKAKLLKRLAIFGPIAALVLGGGAWWAFGPMSKPNYERDNLKRVFSYTLLTDRFNQLPIEERMKLIGQLVDRLKNMSAGDSTLMAAFAVGIAGAARDQIEKNASRLAIDLWDKYAEQYESVKPEDQGAYLDKTAIEFVRMMEGFDGKPSTKSNTEILNDIHKQAQRDMDELKNPNRRPPAQALGRMFTFMQGNVGSHATPHQRASGQLLMRDMVRRMRGQDGGGR
jgi:hypothetical protein